MFCAKCGKEIDNDSTFCPFCGQRTNAPIENSESIKKPKVSVKMPGKKVIGGIAAVVVVLLVVFGISKIIGGIGNQSKSLSEKLFAMSWEERSELSENDLKDMLKESGTLYNMQTDGSVDTFITKTTESFMKGDCIYKNTPDVFADIFVVRYETEDDFKEGKELIENILEKQMIKKSCPFEYYEGDIKIQYYPVGVSSKYLDRYLDQADLSAGVEGFGILDDLFYDILSSNENDDWSVNIDKIHEMSEQYSIYKFSYVAYGTADELGISSNDDIFFPSDKSYTDQSCIMGTIYIPVREEMFTSFLAVRSGYDVISGKKIDIDEFKKSVDEKLILYIDESLSDYQGENRRKMEDVIYTYLYMMEKHKFDTSLSSYVKTDDEKRLWYVRNFEWDTKTGTGIDLSDYRNSSSIYCAVECNYNSDTAEYFESDLDKALYLADKDYKLGSGESFGGTDEKRLWFMQNYSYDTSAGKMIDKAIVDALIAYDGYFNRVKDNMTGVAVRGMLAYLNDDNIPDCILFDDVQANSSMPADSTIYFLSYINGQVIEKVIDLANCDFQYASKSGKICVGGYQGSYIDFGTEVSYGDYKIIRLKDSFEDVNSASWSQVYDFSSGKLVRGEYEINGSGVDSMEKIERFIQSFDCDVSVEACNMTCLYKWNEGIKSSFLNLYDVLRTTTYIAYDPEIVTFNLSDGILTVESDSGVRFGWGSGESFSISYPVAEDCTWEYGWFGSDGFVKEGTTDYESIKSRIESEQAYYKEHMNDEVFEINSPMGNYIEVVDDTIVKVYVVGS